MTFAVGAVSSAPLSPSPAGSWLKDAHVSSSPILSALPSCPVSEQSCEFRVFVWWPVNGVSCGSGGGGQRFFQPKQSRTRRWPVF